MLDPSINSLPYIYALLAKLRETESDGCGKSKEAVILTPNNPLFTKACLFLESFDGRQVRYAGAWWRQLVELVARAALEAGDVSRAVPAEMIMADRSALARSSTSSERHPASRSHLVYLHFKSPPLRPTLSSRTNFRSRSSRH